MVVPADHPKFDHFRIERKLVHGFGDPTFSETPKWGFHGHGGTESHYVPVMRKFHEHLMVSEKGAVEYERGMGRTPDSLLVRFSIPTK